MASLRKFSSSPFWYACFTDAKGARVQLSTKETRRSVAQRIADAWERAAKKELTIERANWIMTDLAEGIAGRRLEIPTLLEFCQEFGLLCPFVIGRKVCNRYHSVTQRATKECCWSKIMPLE